MASRPPVWRRPAGITLVGLAVLGKCNGLVVRRLPSFTEATGLQRARVQGSYLTGATGSQPSDNEAEAPRVEGLWRLFSEPTQKNPFAEIPELVTFMKRFDIPSVHGSGIYVDLGRNTEEYREVSGKCPVFGKVIELHQPADYQNDFLADVPSALQARRKPLPGGFNSPYVDTTGRKFSPISDSVLKEKLGGTKTEIGRCAAYAFATTQQNPKTGARSNYKSPFVYDMADKQCYVLALGAQLLKGEKYCSVGGSPPGLTWSCFEPTRDLARGMRFVYGSAHIGEFDPDSWEDRCPNSSVSDALFGKWHEGECVAFDADNSVETVEVSMKEECWIHVFSNARVASDAPDTYPDTPQSSWRDFWPLHESSSPRSGGVGANWANFYRDTTTGKALCAVFDTVPDCFVPAKDKVAYTALGSLAEVPLPACDPGAFPYAQGECRDCRQTVLRCEEDRLVQSREPCCGTPLAPVPFPPARPEAAPPASDPRPELGAVAPAVPSRPGEDAGSPETQQHNPGGNRSEESQEGGANAIAIAGGVIGGLLLIILVGAGAGYYFQHSGLNASETVGDEVQGGRTLASRSDVAAHTSQSYWGEDLIGDAKP